MGVSLFAAEDLLESAGIISQVNLKHELKVINDIAKRGPTLIYITAFVQCVYEFDQAD